VKLSGVRMIVNGFLGRFSINCPVIAPSPRSRTAIRSLPPNRFVVVLWTHPYLVAISSLPTRCARSRGQRSYCPRQWAVPLLREASQAHMFEQVNRRRPILRDSISAALAVAFMTAGLFGNVLPQAWYAYGALAVLIAARFGYLLRLTAPSSETASRRRRPRVGDMFRDGRDDKDGPKASDRVRASFYQFRGTWDADDRPTAGVRQPKSLRPSGRLSAAAVKEPRDEELIRAIAASMNDARAGTN
jgi:hypothetical protein